MMRAEAPDRGPHIAVAEVRRLVAELGGAEDDARREQAGLRAMFAGPDADD